MKKIELLSDDKFDNFIIRESFNSLRTNLFFCGKDVKTVLISSCMAHDGKTTVSRFLSQSLADAGKKVLFIDADMRRSHTKSRFTREKELVGLSQVLSGQTELEQSVYATQYPNLDFLFSGPFPPNPAELLGSDVFREMLQVLRNVYDYIIIDAPPICAVTDVALIANSCDGSILVINKGKTNYRWAQVAKSKLQSSGCKLLGVVLNQVSRTFKHVVRTSYSEYEKYYTSEE